MKGNPSSFLRRVLLVDAVISGISGIAMLLNSNLLAAILGTEPWYVGYAGASLLPFSAFVFMLAQRDPLSRRSVHAVIGLNAAWVLGSVLLLFTDLVEPSTIGTWFIVLQAAAVAALAELQYTGLRKAWA